MRNPRNQLVIAMVFALLLGVIIVVAARCSSSATTGSRTPVAAKTATPKTTASPSRTAGAGTVVPGRSTDVTIVPPGGQPAPTATQISVGPLPSGSTAPPPTGGAAPTAIVIPPTLVIPAGGITYVVKSGDTLASIAKTYGTTTAMIAQANGITDTSKITVGQKLSIPGVSGPVGGSTGTRTYVVQRGDNLSRIAARYGTTVAAIVKANNIANPSRIYAGQKLIIP